MTKITAKFLLSLQHYTIIKIQLEQNKRENQSPIYLTNVAILTPMSLDIDKRMWLFLPILLA